MESNLWILWLHFGDNILWSHFGEKFLKDLGDIKSTNSGKDMKELLITDKMSCTKNLKLALVLSNPF